MSVLSRAEVVNYASAAGFRGLALDIIVAIAQAESQFDTNATHSNADDRHTLDRGILQINSYWHSEVSNACAFDPGCAFQAGWTISSQGRDFTPWATYTNGAYLQYLPDTTPQPDPAPVPQTRYVFPLPGWTGAIQAHHGSYIGACDLMADRGWKIVAMIGGTVVNAGSNSLGGNTVMIRGDDNLLYYYAHMDRTPLVRTGQRVSTGQQIGVVGNTGNASTTPTHLHLGIGPTISTGAGPEGGAGQYPDGRPFDAVGMLQEVFGNNTGYDPPDPNPSPNPGGGSLPGPSSITVYDQPGYRGHSHTVTADAPQVPVGDWFGHWPEGEPQRHVRSIKFNSPGAITIFQDVGFQGESVVFTDSVNDTATALPWVDISQIGGAIKVVSSIRFGGDLSTNPGGGGSGNFVTFGPVLWTGLNDRFVGLSRDVHSTLSHVPGLYGIALAIDEAEQFPGLVTIEPESAASGSGGITGAVDAFAHNLVSLPSNTIRSIYLTAAGNTLAFVVRSVTFALGLFLVLGLLWQAARSQIDAGDVASVAMALA